MTDTDLVPDEQLVEQAQVAPEGDTLAYDRLVRRHQDRILANCRYLTGSPDDAEDLAQDVFVKAFFGLKAFERRSSFKTWLQKIKVNHCLNHLRKRRDKVFLDVQDPILEGEAPLSVAPDAERNLKAASDREVIREILDSLPETLRVPVILRDLDGLSYQEIAEVLEIGLSATKMRIKRAREEFRARYEARRTTAGK